MLEAMKDIKINEKINKRTGIWLGVIMILFLVSKVVNPLIFPYYVATTDPMLYSTTIEFQSWIKLVFNIFHRSADIVIGIFLFLEAKKVNYNKILWLGLGLVFGIIALILFYVYRVYEKLEDSDHTKVNKSH
jgi:hypothetical protein